MYLKIHQSVVGNLYPVNIWKNIPWNSSICGQKFIHCKHMKNTSLNSSTAHWKFMPYKHMKNTPLNSSTAHQKFMPHKHMKNTPLKSSFVHWKFMPCRHMKNTHWISCIFMLKKRWKKFHPNFIHPEFIPLWLEILVSSVKWMKNMPHGSHSE